MPSRHEAAVYRAARAEPSRWFTNHELAAASGVGYRTTRLHTAGLTARGVFVCERVSPGFRYRLARDAPTEYRTRLDAAVKIFAKG